MPTNTPSNLDAYLSTIQPSGSAKQGGLSAYLDHLSSQTATQTAEPSTMGEFSKGFGRSFAELPGLAAGVGAYAADVVGADSARDSMLGYAKDRQEKVEKEYGSDAASLSNVMDGKAGAGDFLANAAGYVVGQALMSIATGGVGAIGARLLAKQGAKAAAEKLAAEHIAGEIAKGATREAAVESGQVVATNYLTNALKASSIKGATVGAGAQNFNMELGSIYPDAVEQAHKERRELDAGDLLRVGGSAAIAAGVDTAMDRVAAGKIFDGSSGKHIAARVAKEVPVGMGRESITEGIQTGLERYGAGKELTGAEANRDYIDSMGVGAVGGGLAGAGSSLHAKHETVTPPPVNPVAESVTTSAAKGGVLSGAVIAAAPELDTDPISQQATAVGNELRTGDLLEKVRAVVPDGSATNFLDAWNVAKDRQAPGPARQAAIDHVVSVMAAVRQREALSAAEQVGAQMPAMEQQGPGVEINNGLPSSITQAGHQWSEMSGTTPAEDMAAQKAQALQEQAAQEQAAQPPAPIIQSGPRERQQRRDAEAAGQRWQDIRPIADPSYESSPYPAPSTEGVVTSGEPNGTTPGAQPVSGVGVPTGGAVNAGGVDSDNGRGNGLGTNQGRSPVGGVGELGKQPGGSSNSTVGEGNGNETAQAVQAETQGPQAPARTAVELPHVFTPDGHGPAFLRRTKEQVRQMVGKGFDTVERRGSEFFMVNHKTNEEVKLDSQGVAQVARVAIKEKIDADAHRAPSSPKNDLKAPTEGQIKAQNYLKPATELNGVKIRIENPAGSTRSGTSPDGKKWSTKMVHHYGEIEGTRGADGDKVDVFIGNRPDSDKIFVVDQKNKDGSFDEHKVMMGFTSLEDAKRGYLSNYEKGWTGMGAVTEMSVPEFRAWVRSKQAKNPAAQYTGQQTTGNENDGQNTGAAGAGDGEANNPGWTGDERFGAGYSGSSTQQERSTVQPGGAAEINGGKGSGSANEITLERVRQALNKYKAKLAFHIENAKDPSEKIKLQEELRKAPDPQSPDAELLQSIEKISSAWNAAFGKSIAFYAQENAFQDGFQLGDDALVNLIGNEMPLPWTIAHEFKHLSESIPGIKALYDRIYDLIPQQAKQDYLRYLGSQVSTDNLALATQADLTKLRQEMVADFMGRRFVDKDWMIQLSKQKPNLFGQFVKDWLQILDSLIEQIKTAISGKGNRKDIDALMRNHLTQLEEMKKIAMEVAEQWALQNPKLAQKTGADQAIRNSARASLQQEMEDELNGKTVTDEAIKAKGRMAEDAYPDLDWKADSSGFQETAMAPSEGKHEQRIEMNEDLRSDLWEGGMNNTWVGPAMGERDGYATKKGIKDFFRRQVAAIDLRSRKFDLAKTVEKAKLTELVNAWKSMEELDGARRYNGTLRSDMSLKDIAKSMGITDKYDVTIMKAPSEVSSDSINVSFVHKTNGMEFSATLDRHSKDGQRFLTANTMELGKSGLGGAFYQMAAEFAARNNMKLHPEDSLSGINAYRRTEQQLSAALRTGKSNVMVPHKVQRVHGFEDNATRQEQHDANLGRLILAGIRNAQEIVPSFNALRYAPDTGVFTDSNGNPMDKAVFRILNSPDSRAFGMGRSTLARAVMSNMILKGELSADDITSFHEPVLYSARDEAAQQYRDVEEQYRGTDQWMRAPNGNPTKLNERQWVQVRTPNFLKWFGDWTQGNIWGRDDVSKVVDENGEPLVVYHGTDSGGFTKFKEPGGKVRGDIGIFTTSNIGMAESYVRHGRAKDIVMPNDTPKSYDDLVEIGYDFYLTEDGEFEVTAPDGNYLGIFPSKDAATKSAIDSHEEDQETNQHGVYATFINLRNPYETDFEGATWSGERHDQFTVLDKDGEPIYTDDGRQFMDNAEAIDLADARGGQVTDADSHWETTDSAVRAGRSGNNDGTIIRNVIDDGGGIGYDLEPSDVFVANHADQLKSAYFNTGEFGESDDIRYSQKTNEREYKLDINREERSVLKAVRLTKDEQAAIDADAKELGLTDLAIAKVIEAAKETKKRFPVSKGWAPAVVIGIDFKKDDDNLPIPGTEEPKFAVIPYGFNVPPGAKRAPAKVDEKWMAQVTEKFHELIEDLYKRADAGDKNAQTIIAHQTWYRNVAEVLRREYGAQGDLLADLLGATSPNTPVDTNWRFSLDILRRFVRGEFKPVMEKFTKYLEEGGVPSKYPAAEKIRQLSGKLYGMNSGNAMVAMANLWRNIEPGSAPKARNFALNLIGQSNMATIDVWAARMLRRAADMVRGADLPRIPPSSEAGVSGVWNADATQVTGAFGFGAEVMRRVSERMQKDGRNVTPPDLQAIAWFAEKELWGTKGWTTKTGEGGSFEENIAASPVERYLAGWSIQQGEKAPEPGDVSTAQARVMATLIGDDSVVAARAQPTFGLYGGVIEHSFDTEWTVTKGQHDPSLVMAEIAKVSKENGQYDIFVSRVIHPDERSANARPGVEIYFKTKRDLEAAMPVLNEFTSRGQDGFTLATDMRSKPGEFIGVRLQYVPEISMRWDEDLRKELMAPGGIEKALRAKRKALNAIVADVRGMDGVAYAERHEYDTVVVGKENYDAYINRATSGGDSGAGSKPWFGQPLRQGLEGAVARYEGERGQVDAGRVSDAGGELQSVKHSSRDEGHSGRNVRAESETVRGAIHFGKQGGLSYLSGSSSGTGIKGAEQERLAEKNVDPRIKKRVYFYLPIEGGIPQPEIGLGGNVYRANLDGLYDPTTTKHPILIQDKSAFEAALLDAGYKGYINREQGTAVILNSDVPVEHIGGIGDHKIVQRLNERIIPKVETRQEGAELVRQPQGQEVMDLVRNKAAIKDAAPSYRMEYGHARVLKSEAPQADAVLAMAGSTFQFGEIQYSSRDQTQTPAFKRWFGDSKVVDENGEPLVVYHGTDTEDDFSVFDTLDFGAWFGDEGTANRYTQKSGGSGSRMIPVYLKISNPLIVPDGIDLSNDHEVQDTLYAINEANGTNFTAEEIAFNADYLGAPFEWISMNEYFIKAAKKAGFDGIRAMENYSVTWNAFSPTQIKSAISNTGEFDPANPDIRYSSRELGFYSELANQVEKATMKQAPAGAWKSYIKALTQKGVKADEIEWTGINDFLDLKDGKVSKDEILKFLDGNGVQINEVVLGSQKADVEKVSAKIGHLGYEGYLDPIDGTAYFIDPDGEVAYYDDLPPRIQKMVDETGVSVSGPAKYENYVLPGGENYREVLLTLPKSSYHYVGLDSLINVQADGRKAAFEDAMMRKYDGDTFHSVYRKLSGSEVDRYEQIIRETRQAESNARNRAAGDMARAHPLNKHPNYKSSHWDQPNVLAHIRLNDRTDADGNKVLFVEELQSDWQQAKRKGGNVPDAPFVDKTEGWLNLALKRVIKMAVDGSYDKVAFVNGDQSADRYSLAKKVKIIDYSVTGDRNYHVEAFTHDGEILPIPYILDAAGVERHVGKEIAQKIVDTATSKKQSIKGNDLKVGGEGMKSFYDTIVPNIAKDVLKKVGGGKLEQVRLGGAWSVVDTRDRTVASFSTEEEARQWVADTHGVDEDGYNDAYGVIDTSDAAMSQTGFTITDAMRAKVGQGIPLFSERTTKDVERLQKQQDQKKPARKTDKYAGLKVDVPVKIEDTGEIAHLTMEVSRTIADYDSRTATLQQLFECL